MDEKALVILLHDAPFQPVEGGAVVLLAVHELHHEDDGEGAAVEDGVDVVGRLPVHILILAAVAGDAARPVRAGDPHGHIEPVRADVGHEAAGIIPVPAPGGGALGIIGSFGGRAEEPLPVDLVRAEERRVGAARDVGVFRAVAEVPDADEADVADLAGGDDLAGLVEVLAAAALVANLDDLFRGFHFGDHVFALGDGPRQRLLDVGVFPGPHRVEEDAVVEVVGRRDDHPVDVLAREKVEVIDVGLLDRPAERLLRPLQHAAVDVGEGNDLGPELLGCCQPRAAAVAGADAAQPQAVIGAEDLAVRPRRHTGRGQRRRGRNPFLYKVSATVSFLFLAHKSLPYGVVINRFR